MIAWITAKRLPWKMVFDKNYPFEAFEYEFGPYKITAARDTYHEIVIVEKDGIKQTVYNSMVMIVSIEKAIRRAEVWIHRNSDRLWRSAI